jgi:ABC-type lipoprotein export system ATPase subunit
MKRDLRKRKAEEREQEEEREEEKGEERKKKHNTSYLVAGEQRALALALALLQLRQLCEEK